MFLLNSAGRKMDSIDDVNPILIPSGGKVDPESTC